MSPHPFDSAQLEYLHGRERGLLATIAPNGTPQCKPVGYSLDADTGELEIAGHDLERSAKFRNLDLHPDVAFTVQDVPDASRGADGVRFLEVRGTAYTTELAEPPHEQLSRWVIRIRPRRVIAYNVGEPGLRAVDVDRDDVGGRPATGLGGVVAARARSAVEAFVAELQEGLSGGDADLYNRHFAADVMWGSPYGATLEGYDTLHPIHSRLVPDGGHERSRYELVAVHAVTPDVALAHVRRAALDADGQSIPSRDGADRFSEMALYALVRRDGDWWLAAGQNTIVRTDRGAVTQS